MRYKVNQKVALVVNKNYGNGDKLTTGTKGIITQVRVYEETYMVNFEGAKSGHLVLETDIKAA